MADQTHHTPDNNNEPKNGWDKVSSAIEALRADMREYKKQLEAEP